MMALTPSEKQAAYRERMARKAKESEALLEAVVGVLARAALPSGSHTERVTSLWRLRAPQQAPKEDREDPTGPARVDRPSLVDIKKRSSFGCQTGQGESGEGAGEW